MSDPIHDWAREYSGELGELPKAHRPAAQRARLLFAFRGKKKPRSFTKAYFVLASGALAVAGLLLWHAAAPTARSAPAPSAGVLLGDEGLAVGSSIRTTVAPTTISFSGGTRAVWDRNSRGTVSKLSARTVELTLDAGSLDMDVEHQEGRTWIVRSGKFRVYVIGTAFSVSREAASEEFKVKVKRGQVRVESPDLQGGYILLGEREEFGWRPPPSAPPPASTALSAPNLPPPSPTTSNSQARPKPPQVTASQSWQVLARAGKYEMAVAEVEKLGTESVLASSSADDRLLLGNAARYSGRLELGSRAYLAARELGGAAAPLAAYYLAKIALDTNGDHSGAIRWLKTYVREAPSGDLAPSARARLMNLLQATGRHAEAQKVAREYLTLHPTGPNAQTARKLLELP